MNKIYFDNNATTRVSPEVVKTMLPYFTEVYGNPSSEHGFGKIARKAVEESRRKIAEILGAKPEEIIFTSCGTESNNMAIRGAAYAMKEKGNHIITSSIEHHSVLNVCKMLQKEGFEVSFIPVDSYGIIRLDELKKAIKPSTILITIMHANNETGTIQPIEEIGAIARESGIIFHTDAVQTVGKLPMNLEEMPVEMLSFSGHKFHAPKGIGALYIRKGTRLRPLIVGGHHEMNKRAGTENVPYIVGLAKALEIASEKMESVRKKLFSLTERLKDKIFERIPDVKLNGHPQKRLPGTLNISFKFIEAESIILNLNMLGVAVSSGSACTSGTLSPSHVLLAMGIDHATANGAIRFSLSDDNTEEEVDFVAENLPRIVEKLRKISPFAKLKG